MTFTNHAYLPQTQALLGSEGTDHVQGHLLMLSSKGAVHRLAIDGHHLARQRLGSAAHPLAKALSQPLRVDQREHAPKGVG